jgi:hypothetical protein
MFGTKHNSKVRAYKNKLTLQIHSETHGNASSKMHIKNEIKFLYAKKQNLNQVLYTLHLQNAKKWSNLWDTINQNISEQLEKKMYAKYRNINNRIQQLTIRQFGHKKSNENENTF